MLAAALAVSVTVLGVAGVLGVATSAALAVGGLVLALDGLVGAGLEPGPPQRAAGAHRAGPPARRGAWRPWACWRPWLRCCGWCSPDTGTVWLPADGPPWSGWRSQIDSWVRLP